MKKSVSSSLSSFPSVSLNLTSANNPIPENDLVHLTNELRSNQVPSSIIQAYSELLQRVSSRRAGNFISKELTDLAAHSAIILKCLKSYSSWKDSLGTVNEMVEFLGKNHGWVKLKDVVNECASSLSTHVLLALNVSELVLSWKEHLKSSLSFKGFIGFAVKEKEFFVELKESCDFLITSPIQSAFCVTKNDPFLISCMKEIPAHKKNSFNFTVDKNKIFLNISKKIIDRLKQITTEFEKQEETKKIVQDPTKSAVKLKHSKNSEIDSISKLFTDRILLESIFSLLPQLATQSSLEEISQSISQKYLLNLSTLLTEVVQQSIIEVQRDISSKKAEKLHLFNIIESIIRNLIEEEVSNLDLEFLCESEIHFQIETQSLAARNPEAKRRLTRISLNFELEKLADLLFHSLVDSFIEEPWLVQIAENGSQVNRRKTIMPLVINNKPVEEVEDFALEVFTPGIHSPNHMSDKESSLLEESFKDEVKEEMPKKQFSNLAINAKNIKIEAVGEDLVQMKETIEGYFEQLPNELKCCLTSDEIWKVKEEFLNTQFFWIVYEGNVCGFFCFSIDLKGSWVVHHLSCLNIKFLDDLIGNFREYSGLINGEIILQFKSSATMVKVLNNALKKKNFVRDKTEGDFIQYICKGGKYLTSHFNFLLSSVCTIETSSACPFNLKPLPEMIQIGNRHSIISLILYFLRNTKVLQSNFEETPVRLQQDLNELLEIIYSLNFRSYDKILVQDSEGQLSRRCEELSLNSNFSQMNPAAFSVIDLVFSITSVSFVSHSIEGYDYKYLMFASGKVQVKSEDSTLMFVVATADPDISVFFLNSPNIRRELNQGLKVGKTDLFYNIDNLIKALQDEESFEGNLFVPCFSKKILAKVPWIEGYSIETDSGNLVVSTCQESLKVSMEFLGKPNKTFQFAQNKKFCIENDFVFGVYSKQVLDSIESPFYAVLVGREEFVKLS